MQFNSKPFYSYSFFPFNDDGFDVGDVVLSCVSLLGFSSPNMPNSFSKAFSANGRLKKSLGRAVLGCLVGLGRIRAGMRILSEGGIALLYELASHDGGVSLVLLCSALGVRYVVVGV